MSEHPDIHADGSVELFQKVMDTSARSTTSWVTPGRTGAGKMWNGSSPSVRLTCRFWEPDVLDLDRIRRKFQERQPTDPPPSLLCESCGGETDGVACFYTDADRQYFGPFCWTCEVQRMTNQGRIPA